jgi:uncharacterized protein (DUF433 family)
MSDIDLDKEKGMSREEHLLRYARALDEIEKCIEPYRDHKKALKQHYKDNGFLSKEDMSMVLRAYRMLKKGESVDDLAEIFDSIKGGME